VYISDISHMPKESMQLLKGREQPWSLFVCDALHEKPHASHFSLRQSLELLFQLRDKVHVGVLTGFTHRVDQWHTQKCVDHVVEKYPISFV
jgi:hypothetical protein